MWLYKFKNFSIVAWCLNSARYMLKEISLVTYYVFVN